MMVRITGDRELNQYIIVHIREATYERMIESILYKANTIVVLLPGGLGYFVLIGNNRDHVL